MCTDKNIDSFLYQTSEAFQYRKVGVLVTLPLSFVRNGKGFSGIITGLRAEKAQKIVNSAGRIFKGDVNKSDPGECKAML